MEYAMPNYLHALGAVLMGAGLTGLDVIFVWLVISW